MPTDSIDGHDGDSRMQTSLFSDVTGYTENNSEEVDAVYALMERKFIERNYIIDKVTPFRQRLCARYKRSLAYSAFTERFPRFLIDMMTFLGEDESRLIKEFGDYVHFDLKRIYWSLNILLQEISENRPLSLFYGKASDTKAWNSFLLSLKEDKNQWFSAVWSYAECYFYRRIWAIFHRSYTLNKYDYFSQHKITKSMNYMNLMLDARIATHRLERSQENLQLMLKLSLWANKFDYQSEDSITTVLSENDNNLLVDESAECWNLLTEFPLEPTYVDIVCDNAEFELFTDLLLAEYIIETGLAKRVRFHFKAIPWFIADATLNDAHWMLNFLVRNEFPQLASFGRRIRGFVRDSSIVLFKNSNFWTSPHEFNAMKKINPCLYVTLSEATLVIFKGDLNYRKLLSDINYETTTPFIQCLKSFLPTSVCALRSIKSNIYCGLPECVAEWLTEDNPNWMKFGEKAVIQVGIKRRP